MRPPEFSIFLAVNSEYDATLIRIGVAILPLPKSLLYPSLFRSNKTFPSFFSIISSAACLSASFSSSPTLTTFNFRPRLCLGVKLFFPK